MGVFLVMNEYRYLSCMKKELLPLLAALLLFNGLAGQDPVSGLEEKLGRTRDRAQRMELVSRQAAAWLEAEAPNYADAITWLEREKPADFTQIPPSTAGTYLALLGEAWYIKKNTEGNPEAQARAVQYDELSLPFLRQGGDSLTLANTLLQLGSELLYAQKGRALNCFQEAAALFEKLNNPSQQATCFVQMSTVLSDFGRKEEAIQYSRKALDLIRPLNDPGLTTQTCINLGIVFSNADAQDEAALLYDEAISVSRRQQDTFMLAVALMYRGGLLIDAPAATPPDLKRGKKLLDEAQILLQTSENELVKKYLNVYLASYYCSTGNYPEAVERSDEFIRFIQRTNMTDALASAWRQRGIIYGYMGNTDSARYYFQQMLAKGKESSSMPLIASACEQLYQLEKKQGNSSAALGYYEEYVVYHDSMYNQKLHDAMGLESVRLNLEGAQRARREAELQASLLSSRNQLYGAIALGLMAVLGIGGILYRQLHAARKKLEGQNQQLRELNATKDKFFGIIAHDIRNPISALESVGEQMTYYLAQNNEARLRRLADRVEHTAKQLSGLLDNLLSWALLQMGAVPYNPVSTRLEGIAREVIALYTPMAEAKGIRLMQQIPEDLEVFADESALHTILRNLIGNALKFTPSGGEVRLSAAEADGKIRLEVNDTGVGISAEKLTQIFSIERKSSRGTAGEKGSGLGLILCKELIERNLGSIDVMSEPGKGSRFVLSVPKLA